MRSDKVIGHTLMLGGPKPPTMFSKIRAVLIADPTRTDMGIGRQLSASQSAVWTVRRQLEKKGVIKVIPAAERIREPRPAGTPARKRQPPDAEKLAWRTEQTIGKMTLYLCNTCDHIEQMDVSHLTAEGRARIAERLKEGEAALRNLRTRLKESGNGNASI